MERRWALYGVVIACLLALSGCTGTTGPSPPPSPSVAVGGVPFFPQARYQCGPAALATVLGAGGVPVDLQGLVDAVYLPDRRGSLQAELLAATRRAGRLPIVLDSGVSRLLTALGAGYPVLVLQNLGTRWWPRWHYAVVVAFDAVRGGWILRSGRERERFESHGRFLRRWQGADGWAMVVVDPERLPWMTGVGELVEALAAAERYLAPSAAVAGWRQLLERDPSDADLHFALGNAHRRAGSLRESALAYGAALNLTPDHAAARNNYADLLLEAGCTGEAAVLLAPARAPRGSALRAVIDSTASAIRRAVGPGQAACPLPVPQTAM